MAQCARSVSPSVIPVREVEGEVEEGRGDRTPPPPDGARVAADADYNASSGEEGVPPAPAEGPGHDALHRLAGAVIHGIPWTITSHHTVLDELQVVEGIVRFMTKGAAAKVGRYALAGKLETMTKHGQPIHAVTALNRKSDEGDVHRLRHAAVIIPMTMNGLLLSSRVLPLRRWPRSIPRC